MGFPILAGWHLYIDSPPPPRALRHLKSQPHCLFNILFGLTSKRTWQIDIIVLCGGNQPVICGISSRRVNNAENVPDISEGIRLGRVTHICASKLTIIGSDNGLSPCRRQAIIWTNDGILLIRTLGTNFSEILSEIHSFSFKKMHLKMSSAKWRLFCLGLNELIPC